MADRTQNKVEMPNDVNMVVLSGRVASRPTTRRVERVPLQLQINLAITVQPGKEPLTQPVVFLDPPNELVEEAIASEGRWAYFSGRVASALVDGRWETHVLGSEIRFMDFPPTSRDSDAEL